MNWEDKLYIIPQFLTFTKSFILKLSKNLKSLKIRFLKILWLYSTYSTLNVERYTGLKIHSFSPMMVFTGILSQCLGQQCLLFNHSKVFTRKLSLKRQKFSPVNLSTFMVYSYRMVGNFHGFQFLWIFLSMKSYWSLSLMTFGMTIGN